MRLVVFGGTGGTGRSVIARALAAGHEVVAIARRPDAITTTHDRLTVVKGDALDKASFQGALSGADAVISTIGPASMRSPGTLLTDGARAMCEACAATGVRRLVFESGLIAGDGAEHAAPFRWMLKLGHAVLASFVAEKRASEAVLQASDLDWVIVRPPGLDHSPASGAYKVGAAIPINLMKMLSHDDVAELLVQAASDPRYVRQVLNIGH